MRRMAGLTLAGVLFACGSALAATSGTSVKTYTVHMTGGQEVPKGSPSGTGEFRYQLVTKTGLLCYNLTWSGIDTPYASHVHRGAKGKAGPIVIPLSTSAPVKKSGCVTVKRSLLAAIAKNPSAYYVNVHTKKYPGGALRGQL